MSIQTSNRRNLLRRSTTTGEIPTIPGTGATSQTWPDKLTWLDTDIMIGEMFLNTADSRIWFRDDNGIHEMDYSGSTSTFVGLSDTPNTYVAGSYLIADSGGSYLEWTTGQTDTNSIQTMTDFYYGTINTGQTDYSLVVDASGSGFTLKNIQNDFTSLDDTPSSYTSAYTYMRVNSALTGLEEINPEFTFVTLNTNQTINSAKTFTNVTTFNGGIGTNELIFSGITGDVVVTDVSTSTGFTSVNNSTLATTEAIYYYVNSLLYSGSTPSFVTIGTNQTITGTKTFNTTTNFTSISLTNDITCGNNVNVTGDLNLDSATIQYFGDATTDGSYKIYINVDGDLEVQKRVSGSWVMKGLFN